MGDTPVGVELRVITKHNYQEIMHLNVGPSQKIFVAPNAVSMVEAHYTDYAWMRGIYHGKTPVGFVMLADPVSGQTGDDVKYNGWYFLWRLMVAAPFQGKGYGKQALDLVVEYVKTRPNAHVLYTSYHPGEGSPEGFYLNYGFEKTGEMVDDVEYSMRLTL